MLHYAFHKLHEADLLRAADRARDVRAATAGRPEPVPSTPRTRGLVPPRLRRRPARG
ncbi:hypothetical protein RMN57_00275 [Kitasatospora sp. CM 4170]|uniref:Uncharacterized protein n=1 Tax=Kitasatospora aburaviensis TaxID=67265 RepID=A0ABW1F5K6_9ACTN|nr:hypothetical protein [Kitasatospora sp. CM 4170]WNM43245.1 hypothetical protein RMN57_00275 [Kitasatospora sp. CM 4170]